MLLSIVVLALLATVEGRAVNISNTWVLPEEGFPVFYRYFRDRISWYEADAVCQFHHANLVTVDTTAQYDAVRAYLKELDILSAVWVGLIRSNPDGDFTWTDYRGLSGDGYWSSAPDTRSAPLCAAADPSADYRWEARACGGPTVASFICELPVPQWALGNEGCMVRALPALTILYLPESAAVQLTADCGMAGVKKVQCTGNVKREDLLKELSCSDEEDVTSSLSPASTVFNWPASTDSSFTDQDITNDATTEETITTEHEVDINQPHIVATSLPQFMLYPQTKAKIDNFGNFNGGLISKNVNLGDNQDNNIQSNFIPKIGEDNVLTNDQLEKLEDERHMQHKMLHEEIARVGNVENIFTQPTDHFIPPLVMAKAKISDDMTVLSLAEKHAQQLAEKNFNKLDNLGSDRSFRDNYSLPDKSATEDVDKPLISSVKPTKFKDSKKETLKSNLPKKYINDKYNNLKTKIVKSTDTKLTDTDKPVKPMIIETTSQEYTTTTKNNNFEKNHVEDDDQGMDLTVLLKEAPKITVEETSFSGDIAKLETIKNNKLVNYTESKKFAHLALDQQVEFITTEPTTMLSSSESTYLENTTMNHEIIKITIITDNDDTLIQNTSFEVNTKMPVFKDSLTNKNFTMASLATTQNVEIQSTEKAISINHESTVIATTKTMETELTTTPGTYLTSTISPLLVTENITRGQPVSNAITTTTIAEIMTTTYAPINMTVSKNIYEENGTSSTTAPITIVDMEKNIALSTSAATNETSEKTDEFNSTEYHDLMNMTDHQNTNEEDINDPDFQSPLLSGAMEPIHRPPRTRRPQQPNRNKFNPFRILG